MSVEDAKGTPELLTSIFNMEARIKVSPITNRIQDSFILSKNINKCTGKTYKIEVTRRPSSRQVFVASTRATTYNMKILFKIRHGTTLL